MKKVFCDRHPDRPAVATFKIRELKPVGTRPFLLGYETGNIQIIDLCEECAELVRPFDFSKTES